MLKDTTYQQKFAMLNFCFPLLIEDVKKELKNDHLKKDLPFLRAHFAGKPLNKIGVEEMVPVYSTLLVEGNEALGEFVATRWLLKHSEIYELFEKELTTAAPNFAELVELERPLSERLVGLSQKEFGAVDTYLFSVLNAVVFPKDIFEKLKSAAEKELETRREAAQEEEECRSLDQLKQQHESLMTRMENRYEKKLQGLEKKYLQDVETLKNQVRNLQRKLAEVRS